MGMLIGVKVDTTLKFHKRISEVVNKAGGVCHNILRGPIISHNFKPSKIRSYEIMRNGIMRNEIMRNEKIFFASCLKFHKNETKIPLFHNKKVRLGKVS